MLQLLLLAGIIAPVLFVAAFVVEGLLAPGYNMLTDYVSDLTLGADGWMQVASFIICGWLLLAFATGLCGIRGGRRFNPWLPAIFAVMGFGFIAAGAFQIDPTWGRLTLHGQLHYASSFLIGGSMMGAGICAWRDLRADGHQAGAIACLFTGVACLGLFSASLILPPAALPGLVERMALLIGALWIAGFAHGLLRQPRVARHEFDREGLAA